LISRSQYEFDFFAGPSLTEMISAILENLAKTAAGFLLNDDNLTT
jgi:hypothetical protein